MRGTNARVSLPLPTETPLPWDWEEIKGGKIEIRDADLYTVMEIDITTKDGEEECRIADLICRAVNGYEPDQLEVEG